MLSVHQISKNYGVEPVLKNISFSVNAGERLGLVGPNGCGKTTLLRILTGQLKPDSGVVAFTPSNLTVGYLAQGDHFEPTESVGGYLARMEGDLPALSEQLARLAGALAEAPQRADLQREYDRTLDALSLASESAGRGPAVLAALGLESVPTEQTVGSLSGGQKTRLALAGVLLSNPRLLLLDEPTNHLDLDMLEWLEDWLAEFSGGVLIVSHDRAFLDRVATGILEIDPATHQLRAFAGNYTAYLEEKVAEREKQWQAFQDQREEVAHLRQSIAHIRALANFRKGGKADTGDKFAKGFFANRGLETMRRAKSLEQRLDTLLTDEKIDRPGRTWQMKLEFTPTVVSSRDVLTLDQLSVGYHLSDETGQTQPRVLLANLEQTVRFGERIALVGPNGCGKTTLLRTIAGRIPPLAGAARLGANVQMGYMAQEQEDLDPKFNALETIQRSAGFNETNARTFLHQFLFTGDDVFTPVASLSYGERARLMLGKLVAEGCNFLLLDEPINHLDIPARARFEEALSRFEGAVLAVVHDRYFIEGFAATLWEVRDGVMVRQPLRV